MEAVRQLGADNARRPVWSRFCGRLRFLTKAMGIIVTDLNSAKPPGHGNLRSATHKPFRDAQPPVWNHTARV